MIFAAILDSYGKLLVADWSVAKRKYENECKGSLFYHDHVLPAITSMTSNGRESAISKVCPKIHSQMLKVGPRNRISVAHLDGNSNYCHFLVVYWRV